MQILVPALSGLLVPDPQSQKGTHFRQVGNLQSFHVDEIVVGGVFEDFLSQPHPLGSLGMAVTSMSVGAVVLEASSKRSDAKSSARLHAAECWSFFRAISRLTSLKKLDLPLQCWKELTRSGLDVASPLQELEGLAVADVGDSSLIAKVVLAKVVLSLDCKGGGQASP